MALAGHLWAGGPAPIEYIRLILCRDLYHCTPVEVDAIPMHYITEDLAMLSIEAKVRSLRK